MWERNASKLTEVKDAKNGPYPRSWKPRNTFLSFCPNTGLPLKEMTLLEEFKQQYFSNMNGKTKRETKIIASSLKKTATLEIVFLQNYDEILRSSSNISAFKAVIITM